MQTKDRTFSFRAAPDLDERLRAAFDAAFGAGGRERPTREIAARFERYLDRCATELGPGPSDSALIRAVVESWMRAVERTREDERLLDEYRAWATEDTDGAAFRAGALEAAADVWNE